MILAVDPGNKESAIIALADDCSRIHDHLYADNNKCLEYIASVGKLDMTRMMAIEMIACYGMPVGAEVFDTCVWIGRFVQAYGGSVTPVFRKDVKLHLCGQTRAKDGNVRQAILDRFGGKAAAMGKKAAPGPLYGMRGDLWAALGVGITYLETKAP